MFGHGCCQHNWLYHALRWFFGIVIIVIVFCVGVQIGEVKNAMESGTGFRSHHMMQYGNEWGGQSYGNQGYYRLSGSVPVNAPMMQYGSAPESATQVKALTK